MMPIALAHILLPAIVALSILLMLVRPWGISEVWWVSGGAVLLVLLRLVPLGLAGRAVAEGSDVYLFLIGMMLLAELAREQGVFDWVSSVAVRGAGGSCGRLFFLVYAVGTVVTVFMSNDATAVVLTPAILVVVRKARRSRRCPICLSARWWRMRLALCCRFRTRRIWWCFIRGCRRWGRGCGRLGCLRCFRLALRLG